MMEKHKPLCMVATVLMVVGGLNWGLVGLGTLLKMNLNVVNLILGSWPMVEAVVYLLVGVSSVLFLMGMMKGGCGCDKK